MVVVVPLEHTPHLTPAFLSVCLLLLRSLHTIVRVQDQAAQDMGIDCYFYFHFLCLCVCASTGVYRGMSVYMPVEVRGHPLVSQRLALDGLRQSEACVSLC